MNSAYISATTIAKLLADESLSDLRHAYHALEAFQLSQEHRTVKSIIKKRITGSILPVKNGNHESIT